MTSLGPSIKKGHIMSKCVQRHDDISSLESCIEPPAPTAILLFAHRSLLSILQNVFGPPHDSSTTPTAQLSRLMRRSQVGERGEQITVWPYLIPRHLAICEDSQEGIDGVIGESPAILREGRWARGVIGEDLRQHCPCHPLRAAQRWKMESRLDDEASAASRLTSGKSVRLWRALPPRRHMRGRADS
jgi:hypothetical protein